MTIFAQSKSLLEEALRQGTLLPQRLGLLLLVITLASFPGCAAMSNPVANGIPVRKLPPELLGESRENLLRTPLPLLRQKQVKDYKLDAEDVLGIWIEGVLGEKGQPPVVRVAEGGSGGTAGSNSGDRQKVSLGYPIPVRPDGTISLPFVPPINVKGKTVEQVEALIRKAYTVDKEIIKPGQERILVSLEHKREYHILVIRQDGGEAGSTPSGGGAGITGARTTGFLLSLGSSARGSRKGTGYVLDLPAGQNDVLDAVARTGGFPGSDAVDEIIVERGSFGDTQGRDSVVGALQACPPGQNAMAGIGQGTQRIRLPLRYRPENPPDIKPEDVILQTGDIVYIEAREADVYYVAGLLPAGEYPLPRDTDLNVLDAILRTGGSINSSGLNTANIQGQLIQSGFGYLSPTLCSVIRKTPGGGQVVIRVDMDRALRDPRERILIQAKDYILLQERPDEALTRYLSEVFKFSVLYNFFNNSHGTGSTNLSVP